MGLVLKPEQETNPPKQKRPKRALEPPKPCMETAETTETKQIHRNRRNPLPLLKANRKQANLSVIHA